MREYVVVSMILFLIACAPPMESPPDFSCTTDADCGLTTLPTCCGEQLENYTDCYPIGREAPSKLDCANNKACVARIEVTQCVCRSGICSGLS
ncbi:MAG TPA: hypothetical protein VJK52_03035 [Candidatus Nanoarchaeia archaeon]|nr:hypothetical protein [Candidatus Nanoarchaeia archaeon]